MWREPEFVDQSGGYRIKYAEQSEDSRSFSNPRMQISLESNELALFRKNLGGAVSYDHLSRFDWRRQTDSVQQAFAVAAIFTLYPQAVFVDGQINDYVKRDALEHPAGVKAFFNRRFHDCGFKNPRIIFYDTKQDRKLGGGRRGSGRDKLHFHGVFVLPAGWTRADLKRLLAKVFGAAPAMGQRQFHCSAPDMDQHYTHNGVQAFGPVGKALYSVSHAGTTYRDLELNENGKRSRRAPKARGGYNQGSEGLARGIPSNFNSDIVFCDHAAKRAGKLFFDMWVKAERERRRKGVQVPPGGIEGIEGIERSEISGLSARPA